MLKITLRKNYENGTGINGNWPFLNLRIILLQQNVEDFEEHEQDRLQVYNLI